MTISQMIKRRSGSRFAAVAGAAAIALMVAAPASATITSVSPNPVTDGGTIEVDGTVPVGATAYALAICNADETPLGSACSAVPGSYTSIVDWTGNYVDIELTVSRTFVNFSFIPPMGPSEEETTCLDEQDEGTGQCTVVANYYTKPSTTYIPFGSPATYDIAVNAGD